MGGPNLEVFKFGMYILFPISMMYYFGTNLDNRFSVPDFWPSKDQTHKIPFDREERQKELERLRGIRLANRAKRLQAESQGDNIDHIEHQQAQLEHPRPDILQATQVVEPTKSEMSKSGSWSSFFGLSRKQG
ncbi:hypothetical protein AMS68_007191 [Peltaster fructicola]|uniref:Mitochondrial cytochrome c oxidase assembly factor n=1 Tax=Peltaster fructicola TaxID=286661 RepID=A0A6H0Y3T8_9PEZI|nr:hypothetical protein AMS68_007191 [Peltaster fructicola]